MFFMQGGLPPEMFGGMFGGKGKGKGEDDDGAPPKEVENSRLYELLGVEKDASASDIKKAYHKMAMRHHPDKGGDPETFKDIQRAFEVLSDPERRQTYDQYGEEGLQEDSPGHAQDLLSQLFGGKGGGKGRRQRPRTKDQARLLWVTLEQLYSGVTRPLPIARKVVDGSSAAARCEACGGQGVIIQVVRMGPIIQQMQQECPSCHGVGSSARMTTEREVLEVFVEKGAPDGHKIVFHGKSDEAPDHEPGDVVVIVKQQDHDRFMRKGADLYMERDISVTEALTGFKIVIPHLDGRKLVVRSRPGEVLQPQRGGMVLKAVRGGGMPIHQDPFSFGNLFIVLSIRFPLSMDPATAAEIRRLLGERPVDEEEQAAEGEDVEEAVAEDIDPLESAKQSAAKAGAQAYDEDADSMGPGVQCKQQ